MMWLAYLSMVLLILVGVLLMIVILLQRGRGGGLAGAFGGAGGQSAFGTRAGDVFTKITAVMAIIWVFLAGVSRFALEPAATRYAQSFTSEAELEKLEKEQENVPNLEKKGAGMDESGSVNRPSGESKTETPAKKPEPPKPPAKTGNAETKPQAKPETKAESKTGTKTE